MRVTTEALTASCARIPRRSPFVDTASLLMTSIVDDTGNITRSTSAFLDDGVFATSALPPLMSSGVDRAFGRSVRVRRRFSRATSIEGVRVDNLAGE